MSDGKVVFDITGNLSGINSALDNATNTIARQTAKWTVLGQTAMNALTSTVKAGFSFVKDLALNSFEYNAQMETYEVNFKTMLGSAEAAQVKMAELKQYAAKTPFAFGDLADATQTMLAFGMTSEEASQALKYLGDISLGDANKLSSLTLAFGQVSSAGKLAGQDLLQMINAGFNPLKVIAEETGVAYADLKAVMSGEKTSEDFHLRMEAARREVEELGAGASESAIMLAKIGEDGMISADMVAAAMRIATSEGGAFYKALENASTTAQGQISTIKDSWDMLSGKVTGGAFDKLSQEFFPKVIKWLDDLNAAYDKNGFTGLKTAADRIFGEIGGMALDMGADILAKVYNGITGDTKTPEDIKGYLSEIFGAAGDAVDSIKGAGTGFLQWVKDNGEQVGTAAKAIGIGFGVFAMMTNPLVGILTGLAGALLVFTTDWETFEAKYPNIVAAFEDITGIEFGNFVAGVEDAKTKLAAFYNDALAPLFAWIREHGEAMQLALAGIGAAMALMGAPVAGISLVLGVVISNWEDVKTAVDNAVAAVDTFFTQTVPAEWKQFVSDIKMAWQDSVCTPIDNAARAVADFLGIKLPEDWSLTKAIGAAWDGLVAKIDAAIKKIGDFLGLEAKLVTGKEEGSAVHMSESGGLHGGNIGLKFEEIALQADWEDGTQSELQAGLDDMPLSTTVYGTLVLDTSALDADFIGPPLPPGWSGASHATGGLFTAATRFLGADGMHTFGESGTEALLPLDALWRKMGLTFDQAFQHNLGALQYSVMPQIPPAAPPSGLDEDKLAETIAAAVKEAVSGLTVEMDKRKVGKILKPVISQEIADDVNNRRWTA